MSRFVVQDLHMLPGRAPLISEVEAANAIEAAIKAGKLTKHKRTEIDDEVNDGKLPNGVWMIWAWDDLKRTPMSPLQEQLTVAISVTRRN